VRGAILALPFLLAALHPAVLPGQETREWKVGSIEISGNNSIESDDLRDIMTLEEGETFLEWMLQEDLEAIQAHYIANGFIDASVSEERQVLIQDRRIDIEISVYEGTKTYVSRIDVAGVSLLSPEAVEDRLELEAGDPFSARLLDEFEVTMRDEYARRGYPYLEVVPEYAFSPERDSVDVVLTVNEGPRAVLGSIRVEGNVQVEESLIRRMLTVESGDVFNPGKLQESQENVYQIGLFKSVFFDVQGIGEGKDTLDLLVEVREDEFRSFGFGAGYSSAQGIKGSGEWSIANLLDRAEKITARSEWTWQPFVESPYNRTTIYALSLAAPVFLFTNARSQYVASYSDYDYDAFDKIGISGGLILTRFYGRKKRLGLQFLVEQSDIFNLDPNADIPEDILANAGKHLRSSVELSYVRDGSDDIFNPTTGDVLKLFTTMAGGPLIGERDYYRLVGEYSHYRGAEVFFLDMILAGHLKLGLVREFGTSELVPPEEQFSIGGANSLRGYQELSIGLLSSDNPRPGNYIIQVNLEGRFHIWRGLDGLLFLDSANIYDTEFFPRSPFLLNSTGVGLRYRTPIGPVRFEQAARLDGNFGTEKMRGRFHLSIGNPF
jgi:outer membrane protein insertion porin family